MHLIFRTALMLCTMLVFVAQALAADVRSYAVLPFKVNGSSGFTYLEKAIPSMLNSRLYWQGHFQPVADAALAKAGAVSDAGSAAKALSATGADYVIWGDVTVMGDNASLDVRVTKRARNGARARKPASMTSSPAFRAFPTASTPKSSGAAVPASLRRLRLQAPGRRTPTLSRRTPRRARST